MSDPQYQLGATTHYMMYRDLSDNKTKFTNNNIDILQLSGVDGLTAVDIQQQNPIMKFTSLNTSVTAHSTLSLGLTGGDYWSLSAGVSGLDKADTDFGFHISKNDTELVTIRNNGNIGFGTTNPEFGLDIASDARTQGDYFVTGNIFVAGITGGNGGLSNLWASFGLDDTAQLLPGNLGLGITNPTNKLDVIGSIGVSGNIVPLLHDTFDLGTTTIRFRDLFLAPGTLHIGDVIMSSSANLLSVTGSINIDTNLSVSGDMSVAGTLTGDISFGDDLIVAGTLGVTGAVDFSNTLGVSGDGTFQNDLNVIGNSVISGTLGVSGDFSVDGDNQTFFVDNSTGFVGIGTTAPNYKLEINAGTTGTIASFYGPSAARELRIDNSSTNFDGDTYTFNAVSSGGEIAFATNAGTERMRIENGGNVGIGTSTPIHNLHLHNDGTSNNYTHYTSDDTGATGTDGFSVGLNSNEEAVLWMREANKLNFATSNTLKMTIDASGNVGIGTSEPSTTLHIHRAGGSGGDFIHFTNDDTGQVNTDGSRIGMDSSENLYIFQNEDADIRFGTSGAQVMRLDNTGQLAIGGNFSPSISLAIGDADTGFEWISDGILTAQANGGEVLRWNTTGLAINVGANPTIDLAIGDSNTGFNQISEDNLGFYTGGSERFRLDNSGNFTRQSGGYITGRQIMFRIGLEGAELGNGSLTGTNTLYVNYSRVSDGGGPPTFTYNRQFDQNNGFDDDSSFTSGTPPSAMQRLITGTTGLYQVNYNVRFSGTTGTGAFSSYLQINGSGTYGYNIQMKTISTTDIRNTGSALFNLSDNQYITLEVIGQGTYTANTGSISAILISTTI